MRGREAAEEVPALGAINNRLGQRLTLNQSVCAEQPAGAKGSNKHGVQRESERWEIEREGERGRKSELNFQPNV